MSVEVDNVSVELDNSEPKPTVDSRDKPTNIRAQKTPKKRKSIEGNDYSCDSVF